MSIIDDIFEAGEAVGTKGHPDRILMHPETYYDMTNLPRASSVLRPDPKAKVGEAGLTFLGTHIHLNALYSKQGFSFQQHCTCRFPKYPGDRCNITVNIITGTCVHCHGLKYVTTYVSEGFIV